MISFHKILCVFALSVTMLTFLSLQADAELTPSDQITIVAVSEVVPDKLEELVTVVTELAEHTQTTEPGAISYRWFLSEDKTVMTVVETYADSAAVLFHGTNYLPFAERLDGLRTTTSIVFYGNVSPDLESALSASGFSISR